MTSTIAIIVTFLMLATTLAWLMVWGRGKWWARALLAAGTIYVGLSMWVSIGDVAGWPVCDKPPQGGIELTGIHVVEPARDGTSEGAIFIWGRPVVKESKTTRWLFSLYAPPEDEPRAWRLPYTREMHHKASAAQKAMANGRMVIMKDGRPPDGANQLPDGANQLPDRSGEEDGDRGSHYGNNPMDDMYFYDIPVGRLPQKDRQ